MLKGGVPATGVRISTHTQTGTLTRSLAHRYLGLLGVNAAVLSVSLGSVGFGGRGVGNGSQIFRGERGVGG